jgi:hypothetical protein
MGEELDALATVRKTGRERFHIGTTDTPLTLLGFWQWSRIDGKRRNGRRARKPRRPSYSLGTSPRCRYCLVKTNGSDRSPSKVSTSIVAVAPTGISFASLRATSNPEPTS